MDFWALRQGLQIWHFAGLRKKENRYPDLYHIFTHIDVYDVYGDIYLHTHLQCYSLVLLVWRRNITVGILRSYKKTKQQTLHRLGILMRGGDKQWKQVILVGRVLVLIAVVAVTAAVIVVGLVVIRVLRVNQHKCARSHQPTPRT